MDFMMQVLHTSYPITHPFPMSFSHLVSDSVAGPLDRITDEASGLRLVVCRTGAEPVSLARRDEEGRWHGFLWRDGHAEKPENGWGNHATVMGYFVHRLWKQESVYDGHVIRGGNHGFLRSFAFGAPEIDLSAGTLTYSVAPERIPAEAYPYRVALKLTYAVTGGALRMTFAFENLEEHEVSLGFGWHPGFAVSSLENARLILPPGTYVRQMAPGDFLDGTVREISFPGGEMPFPKKDLPGSFLLDLAGVPDRKFLLEDPALGHRVEFDYAEVPYLTLWSNGDPFLCVEPCWGLPDSNPPVPFEQKKGIQRLSGKGTLSASLVVKPSLR